MSSDFAYQLLADLVLVLHVAIVAFIVGGLAIVVAGNLRRWHWVNGFWFRAAHLGAIAFVVFEAWIGAACPLTVLELQLRADARTAAYGGGFIEHWLRQVLYYEAPPWVFNLAYTLFGLLVAAAWFYFPPQSRRRR